ncbi:MAG: acetyl-CoA carboxylase biotin carboxyl carrier protein [bacterium]|nr:acetyl-CoA carboxylase biotin carboxyl carrier protein [bacterium]
MTLEEIKELVKVVIDSGVAELEVTRGDNSVRIRRNSPAAQEIVLPAQAAPAPPAAAVTPNPAPPVDNAPPPAPPPPPAAEETLDCVKAPSVGTFDEAAAPDAPAFVSVGDHVKAGQVLCIIESMKLMNEIESEIAGTIASKLVENGKPVEYGEALYSIKPD